MKLQLDEEKPIYQQIKAYLETSIISGSMSAGERIPSTNEFAKFYQINPATAAKGVNELVAEEIIEKRRGVGMFVTEEAREILIEKRKRQFYENYISPLKEEAERLEITEEQLLTMVRGEENHNEN